MNPLFCQSFRFLWDDCDFDVEKITVGEGGHQEDERGVHFCNFSYSGVIYIERLFKLQLPLLLIYIRSWLDEHDDTREIYKLDAPQVELITLDALLYDVQITINFVDQVFLSEVEGDGAIDWNGRKYSVDEFVYNIAESGVVEGANV